MCMIYCHECNIFHQAPHLATLQIIMVMIGRLFGSFGFGLVFLYTAELFPTKIRNTAIGTCSTIGRIGGITAILSQDLNTFWPPLQLFIFGIISIIAGILAAQFPETSNQFITYQQLIQNSESKYQFFSQNFLFLDGCKVCFFVK